MATPPTQDSIRITKSFTYRGSAKTWSNRYYLRDALVGSARTQAVDAVVNAEKAILPSFTTIVRGEYLVAGSDVPVVDNTYTTTGTFVTTGLDPTPGDCATIIRYATTQKSKKNHPIFLFNYYHNAFYDPAVSADTVAASLVTAMNTYGQLWVSGLTYGGGAGVIVRSGPRGAVAQSRIVEPSISHRDFPR